MKLWCFRFIYSETSAVLHMATAMHTSTQISLQYHCKIVISLISSQLHHLSEMSAHLAFRPKILLVNQHHLAQSMEINTPDSRHSIYLPIINERKTETSKEASSRPIFY